MTNASQGTTDAIRVLVAVRMEKHHLEEISAVDPHVKVDYVAEDFAAVLRAQGKTGSPEAAAAEARLAPLLSEAEVLYTFRFLPDLPARAPGLRWIHVISHGIDRLPDDLRASDVMVTTGQGTHDVAVAEHTLMLMLALAKQVPRLLTMQREHGWHRVLGTELADTTLGLVGLGSIGKRVARAAKGLGMKVIATKRTLTGQTFPDVDEVLAPQQLDRLLTESDFLVLAAPLTPDTRLMIGENQLRKMKPSAFLVNIARGELVDEQALIRALKEGWIAGAGLDVFQKEPLPNDSPLWDMPNVIATPHTAGWSPRLIEHANRLFRDNLSRYLKGEPMLNLVDKRRGY